MASAQAKLTAANLGADDRRWRTITLVLLVVALAGAGWYAWRSGLLAPLLGQETAAATGAAAAAASGGAMPAGGIMPSGGIMPAGGAGMAPPGGRMPPSAADASEVGSAVEAPGSGDAAAGDDGAPLTPQPSQASGAAPDSGVAAAAGSLLATEAELETPPAGTTNAEPVQTVASIPAVTRRDGVSLLADDGTQAMTLASGAIVRATGRTADRSWLAADAFGHSGWLQANQVVAFGLDNLAEVSLPSALAALPESLTAEPSAAAAEADPAPSALTSLGLTVASAATGAAEAAPGALQQATIATTGARLNVRSGPGAGASIIAKATSGAVYDAAGRSEAADWILLAQDGASVGWASAAYIELSGSAADLPVSSEVIDAPPLVEAPAAGQAPASAAGASGAEGAAAAAGATGLAGTLVFQQSPGGAIYAYNLESGDLRLLTYGFDPAISPDGTQVAFVRDGGQAGLYLIDIDGGNERVIFDERGSISSPKWNSEGTAIVFARNDEYIECYQVGGRECLVESVARQRFPAEMLETMPLVREYQYRLSVVDANGDNFHDLPTLASAKAPDWSEGGVVYQSSAGLQRTDDAEGATTVEVAFEALGPAYFDPDWQPGGGQIVYQVQGAAQWDLWAVNPDGTGTHALTRPVTTLVDSLPSNVAPAWSPDGEHIVFLSNRTEANTAGAWRLWVMDSDGSNSRVLPLDLLLSYSFGADQVVSWGA